MELEEIRNNLDELDNKLIVILAERMRLIPQVAKYKIENNLKRYQPERESQILEAKNRAQ